MISHFPGVRTVDLVPGYDIREQEIDLQILERNMALNNDAPFVAKHHV